MSTKVVFALAMLVAGSVWAVEVDLPKAEAPLPPVDMNEKADLTAEMAPVSGSVVAPAADEKKDGHEHH